MEEEDRVGPLENRELGVGSGSWLTARWRTSKEGSGERRGHSVVSEDNSEARSFHPALSQIRVKGLDPLAGNGIEVDWQQ
jgi:hypothetical protein